MIVGDWHSDLHEEEVSRSLRRLGHEVYEHKWHHYYKPKGGFAHRTRSFWLRLQNKYLFGYQLRKLNHDTIDAVIKANPEVVLFYRPTHIRADTLRAIKQEAPKCLLLSYNNDDPFSPTQPAYLWRHFVNSIPVYDLVLAYRHHNLKEYRGHGAKEVMLWRSWFVPDRNYPVELSVGEYDRFQSDVVFVGHYEPDGRIEYLEEIVRRGYKLRIFGPTKYWRKPLKKSSWLSHLEPVHMAWGAEYNKALSGAKIALCFLSTLNRDTYTRRCFEIPATKTFMLCQYSDDVASLYKAGAEADFFGDRIDFMKKIDLYLSSERQRQSIAAKGYERVYADRHDIDSRIQDLIQKVATLVSNTE